METRLRIFRSFILMQAAGSILRSSVSSVDANEASSGQTSPMDFMNITGDGGFQDLGFVQIYASSVKKTKFRIEAQTSDVDEFITVGFDTGTTYNYTKDFDALKFVTTREESGIEQSGIIASSSESIFINGIKSDVGSTDGFLALSLMRTSTEFYVAGWPYQPPFESSCNIIPALNHTCAEIYKFFPDGSAIQLASISLNQFDTYRYFGTNTLLDSAGNRDMESNEDMTGYYINATKPIQVLCGHECAQVPVGMPFCDHMVEQIPPVAQLGKFHVVPPIGGRSRAAGYVVRVVANRNLTNVEWKSASLSGAKVLRLGEFAEIVTSDAMQPLLVQCSDTCLVMQYNKGWKAASNDVPSDPFMMLTVPSDHFTDSAGFATANYCNDAKHRIDFDNWITIVTLESNVGCIRFDEMELSSVTSNKWDTTSIPGYGVITMRVTHGFHFVSVCPLLESSASFACYVYGHSILKTSSSAYGFSANYKMVGESVSEVWLESVEDFNQYLDSIKNTTCATEEIYSGANVLNDTFVPFPFLLSVNFDPVTMSSSCFQFYNQSFWTELNNFTRFINYWICSSKMCPYLNGEGVAINYDASGVQFLSDYQGRTNGVTLRVEVVASLDVYAVDFATCRVEIRNFMQYYANWPHGTSRSLLPGWTTPPECPSILPFLAEHFQVSTENCVN